MEVEAKLEGEHVVAKVAMSGREIADCICGMEFALRKMAMSEDDRASMQRTFAAMKRALVAAAAATSAAA
jgi:hypothetical protein